MICSGGEISMKKRTVKVRLFRKPALMVYEKDNNL